MSFDEPGRQQRLDDADERAAGRTGRNDDKSIAGAGQMPLVLGIMAGSFLIAVGLGIGLVTGFGIISGGLVLGGGAVAAAGGLVTRSSQGGGRLITPTAVRAGGGRLRAAFENARDAVDGSPGIDEVQKVEITTALQSALAETIRAEAEREGLMGALNNLPDGAEDAKAKLQDALVQLDRRRDEFLAQCARLQAGVASLAIGSDKGGALTELKSAAADLGSHAEAERELAETLAARPPRQGERG
ncbi:MAG: hypothetical protein GY898_00675 [Proteobacteria bacterium]|nr:hypothetical protein [Pseudomonadota bacterium]